MENCMGRRIEQEARLAVDADEALELLGLGDRALVCADLRRPLNPGIHYLTCPRCLGSWGMHATFARYVQLDARRVARGQRRRWRLRW